MKQCLSTTLRSPITRAISDTVFHHLIEPPQLRAFAAIESNYQAKYILAGSRWPPEWRSLRDADTERRRFLKPALELLSNFKLVGRTEELGTFLRACFKLLGADTPMERVGQRNAAGTGGRVPETVEHPLSLADNVTVKHACTVDAELYGSFAQEKRAEAARFEPMC